MIPATPRPSTAGTAMGPPSISTPLTRATTPMDLDPTPASHRGLQTLPSELLLHLASYLSQQDLEALVKASPGNRSLKTLHRLTFGSRNFAPWRRRWEMFLRAQEAGLADAREKAWKTQYGPEITSTAAPFASSGQVLKDGTKGEREKHFEAVMASAFECFGFSALPETVPVLSPTTERERVMRQIRLIPDTLKFPVVDEAMVLEAIRRIFKTLPEEKGYLRLKKLGCEVDRLRKELEKATGVPPREVQKIFPLHNLWHDEVEQIYRTITAYLFFTSLIPSQLPNLVLRATPENKREAQFDEQHHALIEYFCFLGLWLDLWESQTGMVRYPRGAQPPPKRIIFDAQSRRVLGWRLKECVRKAFALKKPVMGTMTAGGKGNMGLGKRSISYHNISAPDRSGFQRSLSWRLEVTDSSGSPRSSPSPPASTLTEEQQRIVDTDLARGELLKVRAYAGTGKTRSLIEYAKQRPATKFLYVVFNKSAEIDAKIKFGPNVDCKTVHALALRVLEDISPRVYNAKALGTMPIPAHWGNKDIVDLLKLSNDKVIEDALAEPLAHMPPSKRKKRTTAESEWAAAPSYDGSQAGPQKPWPTASSVAQTVRKGLESFWASNELAVEEKFLPSHMIEKLGLKTNVVLDWVKTIWRDIMHGRAPWLPHDAYLKLLHIYGENGGDQRAFGSYDIIMFDEAQDANPCMASIILRQQKRSKTALIVAGDPYQRIYGFRGAGNEAFDDTKFPPLKTCYLTWSFRFGDEVASIANILLRAMGEKVPINGARAIDSVRAYSPYPPSSGFIPPPGEPFTVIFRKNVSLIEYAISFSLRHPEHKLNLRIQRNFQKASFFNTLREAFSLLHSGQIAKTYPLKAWKSWMELKAHVEAEAEEGGTPDSPVLSMLVQLESTLQDPQFLELLDSVEANVLSDKESHLADVVLITAHQAKGLEWDRVHVYGDFAPDFSRRNKIERVKYWREEACILYVALTRARKELVVESPLREWIAAERGWIRTFLRLSQECKGCNKSGIVINEELVLGYGSFDEKDELDMAGEFMCMDCAKLLLEQIPATDAMGPWVRKMVDVFSPDGMVAEKEGDRAVLWAERKAWDEVWRQREHAETETVEEWCRVFDRWEIWRINA